MVAMVALLLRWGHSLITLGTLSCCAGDTVGTPTSNSGCAGGTLVALGTLLLRWGHSLVALRREIVVVRKHVQHRRLLRQVVTPAQ